VDNSPSRRLSTSVVFRFIVADEQNRIYQSTGEVLLNVRHQPRMFNGSTCSRSRARDEHGPDNYTIGGQLCELPSKAPEEVIRRLAARFVYNSDPISV